MEIINAWEQCYHGGGHLGHKENNMAAPKNKSCIACLPTVQCTKVTLPFGSTELYIVICDLIGYNDTDGKQLCCAHKLP